MTTMIAELYDALIAAGTPEDKARKAAEAMASHDQRFYTVDVKLTRIEGELTLVKWMLGATLAGIVSLILKAFFA